ncbi:hypothetical protein CY0110_16077 [Crocosphaera chwakensis CCY0110]|uniref:Glycosyltransferase 61 catalytic domain-containing protein n=1 Tax=Crocosphaera chwakensis CCY0110 TaxID=391612 RepID=A3IHP7_9CHRO|nr:hypothetical protein CY0110_16077 [Crocosphaera chwakensis CCY0110]
MLDAHQNGLFHKGGPIWPDWSKQMEARQCNNGIPVDNIPSFPSYKIDSFIEEPLVWCGPIVDHFGHQIADFSTRLLHSKHILPKAKFVFSAKNPYYFDFFNTPSFFREILNWYNISPNQVKIISQPCIAKELSVAPQSEQLNNLGPSQEYLDLLDCLVEKQLIKKPKQGTIYISRAGMNIRFAGEVYLEQLLRKINVKIIRPETMNLKTQLSEYESSERLIFSEGSAIHGIQLLGRCINEVQVLNRRPKAKIAKNFIDVRADNLTYFDITKGILYKVNDKNNIIYNRGLSILDEDALLDYFSLVFPSLISIWNYEDYLEARDHDIMDWIHKEMEMRVSNRKFSSSSLSLFQSELIETMGKLGLNQFIPIVEKFSTH